MSSADANERLVARLAEELPGRDGAVLRGLAAARTRRFHTRLLNVSPDEEDLRDRPYLPGLVEIRPQVDFPRILHPGKQESRCARRFRRKLIRNQGTEGSCTGQALAAVLDIQNLWRRFGQQTLRLEELVGSPEFTEWVSSRASARMLYEMARALDEEPEHRLVGSSLRNALKAFARNGCCSEESAPYEANEPGWYLRIAQAREARSTNLGAYFRLRPNLYDYHAALNEVGAIYVSAMIHDGWYTIGDLPPDDPASEEPLDIPERPAGSDLRGAHAFAVVGYDDRGFFVLNSWGTSWATGLDENLGGRFGVPGVARWPYEDWRDHVLDAWVFRLGAPTPRAFRARGGFGRDIDAVSGRRRSSAPRFVINGHYLHLKDGRYVTTGRYPNTRQTLDETRTLLEERLEAGEESRLYREILLFFMNGFSALARTADLVESWVLRLRERGVYPIFVFWSYIERAQLENLLAANHDTHRAHLSGAKEAIDRKLEKDMADYGRLVWDRTEQQCAAMCATAEAGAEGIARLPLFEALLPFLRLASDHEGCRLHLAAHGDGALLLLNFVARCLSLPAAVRGSALMERCASATLFSPLCHMKYMEELEGLPSGSGRQVDVVTLSAKDEARDRVGCYGHTLPRLVQNSLFPARQSAREEERILGLYENAREMSDRPGYRHWTCPEQGADETRTHFGMLANPALLESFIERLTSGAAAGETSGEGMAGPGPGAS